MPNKGSRTMAGKNGIETKIAVLAEQVSNVGKDVTDSRLETSKWREEIRTEFRDLKKEVVDRAERHEEQDQKNFKAIDDRMLTGEKLQAGTQAVEKYRRWLIGVGLIAMLSAAWNVVSHFASFVGK